MDFVSIGQEVGLFIHFIELGLFGYFIWLQKKLTEDMKIVSHEFTKLQAEHELFQKIHKCPLVVGIKEEKHEH